MNSTNNSASTIENSKTYLIASMAVVAIVFAILSSSQTVRNYFTAASEDSGQRLILAKIFTSYDDINYVIFKIRTHDGIEIEIYEKDPVTYFQKLKQKFSFPDDKDAFLMVDGNSISLALSDVDQNAMMDIVMPTVDQYGLSRLNVFKYNSELKQFSQSVDSE
ncbi:MAG: hypothetical protein H7235_00640 [Bdellovibrionaceae bacterium]|nr:hypothetical protein [Pseudobdellovibrionaceae bacterium]